MMFRRKKKQIDINRAKNEFEKELEGLIGRENYRDFKAFAFKKSMTEMAVAFMLGAALQKVITSLSNNLIMPVINFVMDKAGTDWREYAWTPMEGLTIELGLFLGAFVDFMLIAIVLFILYKKIISPVFQEEEKIRVIDKMDCPFCFQKIFYKCKRCPHCTSEIKLL
tara:strand:- start:772 stop:1272 length:501 start_codon:yes stop_codon:yes gene_type:complete